MADTHEENAGLGSYSTTALTFIGTLIASPLAIFYYRRADSGRTLLSLICGACLMYVISARWSLHALVWFWATIAIVAGINIALIVFVPWPSTHGIKGPVLAPIGLVFCGLDYLAFSLATKLCDTSSR